MSRAEKLATISVDVEELADLADQVQEIETAIVRANTNAQEIDSIADSLEELSAINSIYNSGISYSTDGVNEYFDANTPANTLASTEFIEMNLTNPQEGDLMSFDAAANNWINSAAPEEPIPVLSFRNKIINGNFDIWQRDTSQTSSGYKSVDRWNNDHVGSSKSVSRGVFDLGQTDVPDNPKYYLRHEVTSSTGAGNYCLTQQKMEGVETLAGKTATLSFWARTTGSNKNIATGFNQFFGNGGSPSSTVGQIGVTTHNLTTSWQKFTATVSIPSISGKTIGTDGNDYFHLIFWFESGSTYSVDNNSLGQQSGTFDIAQVQLEEGPVATEFEHRPLSVELAMCQRYYCEVGGSYYGNNWSGYSSSAEIHFPVTMRKTPTCSLVSIDQSGSRFTTGTSGFWQGGYGSKNSVIFWTMAQASGGNDGYFADCTFDAEL